MKALTRTFEDSSLNTSFQVEEPSQRARVRGVHVVAREEADATAAFQDLAKVRGDQLDSALEDECHGDIHLLSCIEIVEQRTEERIADAARHQPVPGWVGKLFPNGAFRRRGGMKSRRRRLRGSWRREGRVARRRADRGHRRGSGE